MWIKALPLFSFSASLYLPCLCLVLPCACLALSCLVLFLSCLVLSCSCLVLVLSCSCLVVSCRVVSCRVVSCRVVSALLPGLVFVCLLSLSSSLPSSCLRPVVLSFPGPCLLCYPLLSLLSSVSPSFDSRGRRGSPSSKRDLLFYPLRLRLGKGKERERERERTRGKKERDAFRRRLCPFLSFALSCLFCHLSFVLVFRPCLLSLPFSSQSCLSPTFSVSLCRLHVSFDERSCPCVCLFLGGGFKCFKKGWHGLSTFGLSIFRCFFLMIDQSLSLLF